MIVTPEQGDAVGKRMVDTEAFRIQPRGPGELDCADGKRGADERTIRHRKGVEDDLCIGRRVIPCRRGRRQKSAREGLKQP